MFRPTLVLIAVFTAVGVNAASINLNSSKSNQPIDASNLNLSKSNVNRAGAPEGCPDATHAQLDSSKSNRVFPQASNDREAALGGPDTTSKKTYNESRSNNARAQSPCFGNNAPDVRKDEKK